MSIPLPPVSIRDDSHEGDLLVALQEQLLESLLPALEQALGVMLFEVLTGRMPYDAAKKLFPEAAKLQARVRNGEPAVEQAASR